MFQLVEVGEFFRFKRRVLRTDLQADPWLDGVEGHLHQQGCLQHCRSDLDRGNCFSGGELGALTHDTCWFWYSKELQLTNINKQIKSCNHQKVDVLGVPLSLHIPLSIPFSTCTWEAIRAFAEANEPDNAEEMFRRRSTSVPGVLMGEHLHFKSW